MRWHISKLIFAIVAGGSATTAFSQVDVRPLIERYDVVNDRCRGGSGGEAKTLQACAERDTLVSSLKTLGWCYGPQTVPAYQQKWGRCAGMADERTQRIMDAKALVKSQMKGWFDVVTTLQIARDCKVISEFEANTASVKIARIYAGMWEDGGLLNEPLDIRAEISAAAQKGRDAFRADSGLCARAFAQPEDRARIRKFANDLISSM